MHPLYLSIQGPCSSTCQPTAIAFSATDPLVIGGDRVDEDVIHRAIAYALYGRSGWAERQFPDTGWPCMQVTFVFWAHGHAWEVRRTGARLAEVTAREAACSLRRLDDADPTATTIHGARRVDRRLGELLRVDGESLLSPRQRPAVRSRPVEPAVGESDAGDAVAAPEQLELLRECIEMVRRETAALRQETAGLHEATAVAAIADARYHHARSALVERTAVLRETKARHAAAVGRLQKLRARCEPKSLERVSVPRSRRPTNPWTGSRNGSTSGSTESRPTSTG